MKVLVQTFKTHCGNCGEEVEGKVGNLTGTNEIIIDFIDGMEFACEECGEITLVEVRTFST